MPKHRQLVHGDFNPGNILVHNGEISGVLDWEYAHSGSRYMDIANLLRSMGQAAAPDIERGMAEGGAPLPPDWLKLAALIDLSSHLEFLTSARAETFKTTRVSLVDKFICEFEAA